MLTDCISHATADHCMPLSYLFSAAIACVYHSCQVTGPAGVAFPDPNYSKSLLSV